MPTTWALLSLLSLIGVSMEVDPPRDGTYLVRLILVRHGFSCANVPWKLCTTDKAKLTPTGMGPERYNSTLDTLDKISRERLPEPVGGINREFGIKPRNWRIPGKSKTADGKSEDCIFKVNKKSLTDNDYTGTGNLVALHDLYKDPHLTACSVRMAQEAARVFAAWLEKERIEFDLLGSSELKRAIETAELVFKRTPYKAAVRKIRAITVLPYMSEKDTGTPIQPQNYPYSPGEQQRQMRDLLGADMTPLHANFTYGHGSYPAEDQQWDKFKAFLALELVPRLAAAREEEGSVRSWRANRDLVGALEAGRAFGLASISPESNFHQVKHHPLREVKAGPLRYAWQAPFEPSEFDREKQAGAPEFVVGVGSHAGLLGQYCLEGTDTPPNFGILEKRIQVRVRTDADGRVTFHVAEAAGRCRTIMKAPARPESGTLTVSDLGRHCDTPVEMAPFIDLQPDPADGRASTCVAAAREGPGFFQLVDDSEIAPPRADVAGGTVGPGIPRSATLLAAAVAAFGTSAAALVLAARRAQAWGFGQPRWPPAELAEALA